MTDSTPIRTAMSEAYLGDSKNFHAMFAAPQTFDLRLQNILSGFAQQTDSATADDLAMAANLRAIAKEMAATDQVARIAFIEKMKTFYTESARIVPVVGGVTTDYTGIGSTAQASTFFQGMITRHSQYSWSVALFAEFPIAVLAGVVQYTIQCDKTVSPLFYAFCVAAKTLGPTTNNAAGTASFSRPPQPFHPLTDILTDANYGYLHITDNRTPNLKHVIGNNCDLSCVLHFDLSP